MDPVLTTNSIVLCPHGGQVNLITSNALIMVNGAPVIMQSDIHPIVGCPFNVSGAPSPCLTCQFISGSLLSAANGMEIVLSSSVGLCLNAAQAPQGNALIAAAEPLVQTT